MDRSSFPPPPFGRFPFQPGPDVPAQAGGVAVRVQLAGVAHSAVPRHLSCRTAQERTVRPEHLPFPSPVGRTRHPDLRRPRCIAVTPSFCPAARTPEAGLGDML